MTDRSRSPPPAKVAEEPSLATIQDTMFKQFEQMMKKFEQLEGNRIAMNNGMGVMGSKINDMEASANLKFESLEKRLDQHDLAINEIKNVKGGTSGGRGW